MKVVKRWRRNGDNRNREVLEEPIWGDVSFPKGPSKFQTILCKIVPIRSQ